MVSSKTIHCAYCQKKCSGSVLRYQDQYYHKQCFERLQSELAAEAQANSQRRVPDLYNELATATATGSCENNSNIISSDIALQHHKLGQQTRNGLAGDESPTLAREKQKYYHSKSSEATNSVTTKHQNFIQDNNDINKGLPQMAPSEYSNNKYQTLDSKQRIDRSPTPISNHQQRSATLPASTSNGLDGSSTSTKCAGCKERIRDGQALLALDLHWHVWCFKCTHCKAPLHGEYVAKDGKAYCEKDYQKLFGIICVYCKRFITGKVLQAGEAHHFHPSCARCSKCGDPFVTGEEMYLQGEVTWHPRCGPGYGSIPLSPSQLNDSSSMMGPGEGSALDSNQSRLQYGRTSPAYADSEAVGDLSRIYTISYLNADPNQGYLKRPLEPYPPKSPQFSRPTSLSRLGGASSDQSRCSSRSQQQLYLSGRERSVPPPRGIYSVLSSMGRSGSSSRARSPSMMNEEAIQLAAYPSGQKPSPDSVPKIERDDFPAPPFPYPKTHSRHHHRTRGQSAPRAASTGSPQDESIESRAVSTQVQHQERASRPRSREYTNIAATSTATLTQDQCSSLSSDEDDGERIDPQFRKEEEELSKIANGIGKVFLQTLKEREKLRAWKRAHLDPRNASRTPSATRELSSRPLRYDNPTNASPSRDLDRPRPWGSSELQGDDGDHSPTRTRSSLSRMTAPTSGQHISQPIASSTYGYKVVQSNCNSLKPGYGFSGHSVANGYGLASSALNGASELSFGQQQRVAQARATDLLGKQQQQLYGFNRPLASSASAHLRRSMPNVANSRDSTLSHHKHLDGPPKLYPYHLLATTNYRLPPDVDRCHLEHHLSNEEFQYIFHCDRLDFYRMPEWKRNELKRRAKLF